MMPTKVTRSAADLVEWIVRATARMGVRPCLPEVVGVHAQGALEAERRPSEKAETLRARPSAVMTPRIRRAGEWKAGDGADQR
jgi:hypothetical protein